MLKVRSAPLFCFLYLPLTSFFLLPLFFEKEKKIRDRKKCCGRCKSMHRVHFQRLSSGQVNVSFDFSRSRMFVFFFPFKRFAFLIRASLAATDATRVFVEKWTQFESKLLHRGIFGRKKKMGCPDN